eukprot:XP_011432182.1 PREDICTED: uncharacterized protein LOC105331614 [Crassostrea gigas]
MMVFGCFFYFIIAFPWYLKGQTLYISTKFVFGNVIFSWQPLDYSAYYVQITRDTTSDTWVRVNSTHYTVGDVLLFDSISINVRTSGSADNNIMTYNVSKVQTQIGNTMNLSWTAPFFPLAGQYLVYHTHRENRTILSVSRHGVRYGGDTTSAKYTYLTRPFLSTNIMFEIRNITLDDAGYYNGGHSADDAWWGGGVVLVVSDKPSKPKVTGDLNVEVNRYTSLTCSSQSTSAPDYYSRLVTLSYTWFVNETKIDRETTETPRLYVAKDIRYNRYSCTATEEDMESDRSDPVQINPLYTSTLTGQRKMNIQELEIENLRLENAKLQKEIKKLEVETEVLQSKKNFYDVKLQVIRNEHPEVLAQMLKDNGC